MGCDYRTPFRLDWFPMDSEAAVSLPRPALRPYISRYAGFRATGLPPTLHHGLPSTEVDLIISLARPIDIVQMPNSTQSPAAFHALLAGLQTAPAVIRMEREAFGIHVFIKALAARAILGVSSTELASHVVDLSDLWRNRTKGLVDSLCAAATWQQRFDILDKFFLARLAPRDTRPEVSWALNTLRRSHGAIPIQHLADETGFSRRHFSERFQDAIGVSPKSFARVLRFERACHLIAGRSMSLAHVAHACGFTDQAHMTREWNALAGCSPREWIARELPFLQDYELGGSDTELHEAQSLHQRRI
jgi:AraC-like DNA-binding protein